MLNATSAKLKIERAKQHLGDFDLQEAVFLSSDPYGVALNYDPELDATVFYLDRYTPPPPTIMLLAGDAAHNLRSALDHLACALIRSNGKEVQLPSGFPIHNNLEAYKAKSGSAVKGIANIDEQAIDSFKPYGGGNEILLGLHRLDIIDKHDVIVTGIVTTNEVSFVRDQCYFEAHIKGHPVLPPGMIAADRVSRKIVDPFFAEKDGDEVFFRRGKPEENQDVELTFSIAFGKPEIFVGRGVSKTLHELVHLVEEIVGSFE